MSVGVLCFTTDEVVRLGSEMRHLLTAMLCAVALSAACLPFGTVAAEPAVSGYNWTGFYVGGNVGYGLSNINNDFAFAQPLFLGGNATLNGSDANRINGAIGGGQFGYNWQIKNYLLGIEADLQVSGQKNSTVLNSAIVNFAGITPGSNPTAITYSDKLGLLSTLRGRFGFISGPWLMYGTGGLAIGRLNSNGVIAPGAPPGVPGVTNLPGAWDQSTTKIGWTIGLGVESAITSNWSWKVEYLYLNFGSVSGSATLPATNCYAGPGGCFNASAPGNANISSKFSDNIVRVGLNYKLGN